VKLMMDPLALSPQPGNILYPNVFTRRQTLSKFVRVCYGGPQEPVQARGNYWGYDNGLDLWPLNPLGGDLVQLSSGQGCAGAVAMEVLPTLSVLPLGCATGLGTQCPSSEPLPCGKDCPMGITQAGLNAPAGGTVRSRFMAGLEHLDNDDFEAAKGEFSAVATKWSAGIGGGPETDYCKGFIRTGRALAEGGGKVEERQAGAAGAGLLSVRPNPATDALWVSLPEGSGPADLRLWDAQGRLVAERPAAEGPQRFDVGGLPPGLYWVEARYGSTRLVAKAVIRFFD
jgi:hypothetical protein